MILCDTDVLIEHLKGNETVMQALRDIGQGNLAVSDITAAELYFGAMNKGELLRIRKSLAALQSYPLSDDISARFLGLMQSYALSHKLALPDALIAATALMHGVPLFTLNTRDFRFIDGLSLHHYS
jgi:predicted nucleic acid-binding protein